MAIEPEIDVNGTRLPAGGGDELLLHLLRERFGLTGSKISCGEGECGACTVLVDGEPVRACVTAASAVVGRSVLTIEGLERDGSLHPLQQAFLDLDALQCGYCTPGMIMSGVALLSRNPDPTEGDIISFMQGHICRCGAYPRIIAAIQRAAADLRAREGEGR